MRREKFSMASLASRKSYASCRYENIMTVYSFKAVDERGLTHKGLLEADNTRQLRQQLRARGLMPVAIAEAAQASLAGFRKPQAAFSTKALTGFTRELAILIEGGLTL